MQFKGTHMMGTHIIFPCRLLKVFIALIAVSMFSSVAFCQETQETMVSLTPSAVIKSCAVQCPGGAAFGSRTLIFPDTNNQFSIYERNLKDEWVYRQAIKSPLYSTDSAEHITSQVALSEPWLLVLTQAYSANGDFDHSYLFVYHYHHSVWQYWQQLTVPLPQSEGVVNFPIQAIALDGEHILISTLSYLPISEVPGGSSSERHVYAFGLDRTQHFRRETEIIPAEKGNTISSYFGARIALSGNTALVTGDPLGTIDDALNVVRVFERVGTHYYQKQVLKPSNGQEFFGLALAIKDDVAVIGAPYTHRSGFYEGSAYIYERHHHQWQLAQQIFNPLETQQPHRTNTVKFGDIVAVDGRRLIVSSYPFDPFSGTFPAYLFEKQNAGTIWNPIATLGVADGILMNIGMSHRRALVEETVDSSDSQLSIYTLITNTGATNSNMTNADDTEGSNNVDDDTVDASGNKQ